MAGRRWGCSGTIVGVANVKQRDVAARVWGTTTPGGDVAVAVSSGAKADPVLHATAGPTGVWQVDLPARTASADPSHIRLSCAGAVPAEVVANGVLFGDVYGCHGQSNMQFGLSDDMNATTQCLETKNYPHIRFSAYAAHGDWSVPSNATACHYGRFQPFSAVCWYFGVDLFTKLGGQVPIGLVASEVGGTPVEAWSGPDALAKCNQTQVTDRVSTLWTKLIVPLLNMQMSGWVWYQGENNVGGSSRGGAGCCAIGCPSSWKGRNACSDRCNASATLCAGYYGCQFPAMIEDWRSKWNGGMTPIPGRSSGPRPFVFVMLAPYEGPISVIGANSNVQNVALLRQSQTKALALPGVGMASAIDWGDMASPNGDIHPRWKSPVGARLGLAMAALAYSTAAVNSSFYNPTAISATVIYRPGTKLFDVRVTFNAAVTVVPPIGVGGQPVAPSSATLGCQPLIKRKPYTGCAGFEVDTVPADKFLKVSGDPQDPTVLIVAAGSATPPTSVAYLNANWPVAIVWEAKTAVPVSPFTLAVVGHGVLA